jgi:hypothetical protein
MFYVTAEVVPQKDPVARRLGEIADILFRYSRKDFNIRIGTREIRYTAHPRFVVRVDEPRTVRELLLRPTGHRAVDAFIRGRVAVEGDLLEGLRTRSALHSRPVALRPVERLKLWYHLLRV